jgi:hypothetical protein
MLDAFHLKKITLNVNYFVAKYKQSSIFTSILNTKLL